ncbi:MAG: type I DNA topoisomerase [Candidatus Omnitrophota bacterium]|nr:MAG: type I DNA topoisomerase [Candidatus Omnitrophota bacterium]
MSKYLVIVESPTKARTITAILGKDYEVASSMGHVVDLPSKKISVDVEKGFEPQYHIIPGKEKIINQLKKKAKNKKVIYLATDPDREGEAISWHIKERLSKAKEDRSFYRVTFHEITKDALKEAFANPSDIDTNKVEAQIARRVLDRIVGYCLSPLLWRKIVRGLSAGRVQSIALKFIAEREKEIEKFIPKITYSITAKFKNKEGEFEARLDKYKGDKALFEEKEEALKCIEKLKEELFNVKKIVKKEVSKKPLPPYTTSLLQQDAFGKLRFSSQKTMIVAQHLYEGTQIKDVTVGLITYMRTDSFHIAPKAKKETQKFIKDIFGQNYLPEKEHHYKTKKGAQLAHEAIRPSSIKRQPQELDQYLNADESKLYNLIWKRFIASLMSEAIYENTKVHCEGKDALFVAEGRKLMFDGFLKVYGKEEEEKPPPSLSEGQELNLEDIKIIEHTTKPPPRFNDASLVKILEEKGIGRPSTYAPTIFTLIKRNYTKRVKGSFHPTDLGIQVNDLLTEHFTKIVNDDFTAQMEENLDKVEEGELKWKKILQDFYPAFKEKVDEATSKIKKHVEFSEKTCPKCQGRMVIKWSRKGRFLSCENFPKCRYAESITTGVKCPECQEGELIERRNKRGQFFYGCSQFPKCHYTSRNLPKEEAEKENEEEKEEQ